MNWNDLRHLEAIARLGGVRPAAQEARVSVSTVYRRIGAIEDSLGELCLVRGSAELTPRGLELAGLAKELRARLDEAASVARARQNDVSGEVSLTTVEGFLPFLIEPIARLSRRHPGLSIRLHLGDSGPSVERREVDLAIGVMREPPPGCIGRRVLRIRYGVFGTEDALRRAPSPLWIVSTPRRVETPEATWERENAGEIVATAPRLAMLELIRAGLGVGLLPRPTAALHPELLELKSQRASSAHLERTAWLIIHPDQRRTPRIRAVVEELRASLGALGG